MVNHGEIVCLRASFPHSAASKISGDLSACGKSAE